VVSFDPAATGVTITVDGNSNAIAFNAATAAACKVLLEAATNAAATRYPIEAKIGDVIRGEAFSTNWIIDDAAITMLPGKWYELHLDTSNCLLAGIKIEAQPYPRRLMSANGTFTAANTENMTLAVYEENPVNGDSNCIHSEAADTDAMTAKSVGVDFPDSKGAGYLLNAGLDYVVKWSRSATFTTVAVNVQVDPA
jgi:hypothetical protein